jgi:hypothetical protein
MTDLLFGLNVAPSAAPGTAPVALARRAEELGFDFVSASECSPPRARPAAIPARSPAP